MEYSRSIFFITFSILPYVASLGLSCSDVGLNSISNLNSKKSQYHSFARAKAFSLSFGEATALKSCVANPSSSIRKYFELKDDDFS
ncbi:MAG TPA: hypothetical protein VHO47_05650 [Candidatus Babeliales bacterium]|nr:hypothetical protein [Candidatus Babeliales bacterium]